MKIKTNRVYKISFKIDGEEASLTFKLPFSSESNKRLSEAGEKNFTDEVDSILEEAIIGCDNLIDEETSQPLTATDELKPYMYEYFKSDPEAWKEAYYALLGVKSKNLKAGLTQLWTTDGEQKTAKTVSASEEKAVKS